MLKQKTKLVISGESVIDDNVVCVFNATIECDEPEKMSISQYQRDKDAYKEHCAECRADYAAFEDAVWAVQAKLYPKTAKE